MWFGNTVNFKEKFFPDVMNIYIAASASAEITANADTTYPVLYTSLIVRNSPKSQACKFIKIYMI